MNVHKKHAAIHQIQSWKRIMKLVIWKVRVLTTFPVSNVFLNEHVNKK